MDLNADMKKLFTIGYSPHTLESFISVLKKHQIEVVADVRSVPFSQYNPAFNCNFFSEALKENKISYVFLGKECGARISDRNCYRDGRVDYNLVAKSSDFQDGLNRIRNGLRKFRIALMCAEKDPITCHRTILICKNLRDVNFTIQHIMSDGSLEEQSCSEKRLLRLFGLDQADLFTSRSAQLEEAYDRQAGKIAYKEDQMKETGILNEDFEDGQI